LVSASSLIFGSDEIDARLTGVPQVFIAGEAGKLRDGVKQVAAVVRRLILSVAEQTKSLLKPIIGVHCHNFSSFSDLFLE
jgi:hypothetical protein